ncbi:MAG: hypothetical protein ACR5KV_02205 [Wolbachia sp.]
MLWKLIICISRLLVFTAVLDLDIIYVIPATASVVVIVVATIITIGINSIAIVSVAKSAIATAVPNNAIVPQCCSFFSCVSSASFRRFFILLSLAKSLGVLPFSFFSKEFAPFSTKA